MSFHTVCSGVPEYSDVEVSFSRMATFFGISLGKEIQVGSCIKNGYIQDYEKNFCEQLSMGR